MERELIDIGKLESEVYAYAKEYTLTEKDKLKLEVNEDD